MCDGSPSAAPPATRLVRGGRGAARIHLATCRYAKGKVHPWVWAEGRPDEEWVVKAWLVPCRSCLPEQAALQDELKDAHNLEQERTQRG